MMSTRSPIFRGWLAAAAAAVLAFARPAGAEFIRSFDADVALQGDASIRVTEIIAMDFEQQSRHGIIRMIPVNSFRGGLPTSIDVDVSGVSNARGGAIPYKLSREGAYLKIQIGSPYDLVTGLNTYRISYTVRRAVRTYNGHPEVYWNVTGDKWPYPIVAASARFIPPPGVKMDQVTVKGFRGYEGSREAPVIKRQADYVLFRTGSLGPSEGLTIVAQVPKDAVKVPISDHLAGVFGGVGAFAILPLLAGVLLYWRWSATGRDALPVNVAGVEWDPPKDLSPAEVGSLVDERCDMADIVSTVVDLAARGYLRIEATETERFVFFTSKQYTFVRTDKPADPAAMAPHEHKFLIGLFGSSNEYGKSVTLSELRNKFYIHIPGIRTAIYESLARRGLFTSNPETVRTRYLVPGIVLFGVSAFTVFFWPFPYLFLRAGGILAGIVLMLFSRAMPSRTAVGCEKLREALGFQRFVKMAEKRRIEVLAKEDPTVFGRMLPYAMVLGVADEWANAFKDLIHEPPDWYTGPYHGSFSSHEFINDLGSGMTSMAGTFSSTPSSGGGSGFSGGGGSGGGFGGGGGGSW